MSQPKILLLTLFVFMVVNGCAVNPPAEKIPHFVVSNVIEVPNLTEVSGVAFLKKGFSVVGDDTPEYAVNVPSNTKLEFLESIEDLESIEVSYDDHNRKQFLVISESNRSIIDHTGKSYQFDEFFEEECGKGIEGLTLRRVANQWQVAVLWEGGFYNLEKNGCDKTSPEKKLPIVAVMNWEFGVGVIGGVSYKQLRVPVINDKEAFRAPDLTWYGDSWLVLLSSTGETADLPFNHTWIAKFNQDGEYIDTYIKMENELPEIRRSRNWEALDWSDEKNQLVIGYDSEDGMQFIYVLDKE